MTGSISSSPAEPDWAAFAAIDWATQRHFWALRPASGGPSQNGVLDNTPEAVELWAMQLHHRFPTGPIAVAVEQKRGAVIYMLSKYDHLVLYPVPPAMSASYRRAFFPSGAKSDPADAELLLSLLVQHRDRLRPRQLDTSDTRLLQFLTEWRRQLVQQKVDSVLRLIDCVQQYFPQLRKWFPALDAPIVTALLQRWPTLPELQRAHPGTLHRFFVQHNCRHQDTLQQRIDAIYAATPAVNDPVVIEACTRKTQGLLAVLDALRPQIADLQTRIQELVAEHPDAAIFASFPGAGTATVPRLIAAFGTRREAYSNVGDLHCLSGIAPAKSASGNTSFTHFRRACPKFFRQTFHEFAGQSIPHCPWAKLFYESHLQGDKSRHHMAVRALAFKWIRILYRCWKDRQPYDENIFVDRQRRSPHLSGRDLVALWKTKSMSKK
jgi:transposase